MAVQKKGQFKLERGETPAKLQTEKLVRTTHGLSTAHRSKLEELKARNSGRGTSARDLRMVFWAN